MPIPDRRSVLVISCLIFLSLGIFTAALGPLLPEFSSNNGVSLAAMGSIFTAIFLGALVAQLAAGALSDRVGQMPVLVGAALLLAIGSASLSFSHSFVLTLALTFLAGLGHGAVDLSTNVLIARTYSDRSVSALNLLNLFFGIGAFAGPALSGLFFGWLGSGLPVLWLVALLLLGQTVFVMRARGQEVVTQPSSAAARVRPRLYHSTALWLFAAMLLLYVGAENGISGWITTYMQKTTAMAYETATLIASTFWIALTGGRLVGALVGMRWSAQRVLSFTLAGALVGGVVLAAGTGVNFVTIVGVVITGFCFGSVFPTVISMTTGTFSDNPGEAVGVVTAAGSIGGMVIPWTQGLLLEQVSARVSMSAIALIIALLVAVFVGLQVHGRSPVGQPERG